MAGSVRVTIPTISPTECRQGCRLSARDWALGPYGHTHTQSHVSHAYTTLSFTPSFSLGTVAAPLMAATPRCLPPLESTRRTTQIRMPYPLYVCWPLRNPVVYATMWAGFRRRAATRLRSRGAHGSRQCCYLTGSCDHCRRGISFSATQVFVSNRFWYIFPGTLLFSEGFVRGGGERVPNEVGVTSVEAGGVGDDHGDLAQMCPAQAAQGGWMLTTDSCAAHSRASLPRWCTSASVSGISPHCLFTSRHSSPIHSELPPPRFLVTSFLHGLLQITRLRELDMHGTNVATMRRFNH